MMSKWERNKAGRMQFIHDFYEKMQNEWDDIPDGLDKKGMMKHMLNNLFFKKNSKQMEVYNEMTNGGSDSPFSSYDSFMVTRRYYIKIGEKLI